MQRRHSTFAGSNKALMALTSLGSICFATLKTDFTYAGFHAELPRVESNFLGTQVVVYDAT